MTEAPNKDKIQEARAIAGLTQTEAAAIIGKTLRAWQYWEAGERKMDGVLFEMFLIKCKSAKGHEK